MATKNMIESRIIGMILCLTLIFATASGHDYTPGESQKNPILLKGGNIYTVSGEMMEQSDILFENGLISAIGTNLSLPENTEVIDVTGQNVYPGMIASNTSIGLIEIGAVTVTDDRNELGQNNPDVQSHIAYNPDSEIIPVTRSNGITTALIVPSGGLLRGQSSLLYLDGWTKEDAMVKQSLALHMNWPRISIVTAWWMDKSAEEQKKENAENIEKIYKIFDEAVEYRKAKMANPKLKTDSKMEAMMPVFSGDLPVFVHANDLRQIESAIAFAKKYQFKIVLVGGKEAWKITDLLIENKIPVILGKTQSNPMRQDDDYDISYKLPKLLSDAGVKYCLSYGSASNTRNLPFQAGQAVAFGLSKEEALKTVTLFPAQILGVDNMLGSLEVGKSATIIVSSGDLLDILGNDITLEFIAGKTVNLDNRHKEFYRKYRAKN